MMKVSELSSNAVQEAEPVSVSTPRSRPLPPAEPIDRNGAIPPLKDGDRLNHDEFMRRYGAMPDLKKAELIEGVVHVPTPVRSDQHGEPHSKLGGWLFLYRVKTPGLKLADNATVCLDIGNTPQPDDVLFIKSGNGGQARVNEDGYIQGAPELVAEVAASMVSYDLHDKLRAYERNGVREYVVWRVLEREVDWFVQQNGRFEKLAPGDGGILRSAVFPGLWLDPLALLNEDFDRLLDVLQSGLDSPEHAEFVAHLRETAAKQS
jgi:Uma2 family endonuclease